MSTCAVSCTRCLLPRLLTEAAAALPLPQANTIRTVSLIPNGFIRTMVPLTGYNFTTDNNWNATGKNWLMDVENQDYIRLALRTRR